MTNDRSNTARMRFALLLALGVLFLLIGCASSPPPDKGYVEAGPNATPAKKGQQAGGGKAGTEAP